MSKFPKVLLDETHETAKDLGIAAAIGVVFLWLLPSLVRCLFVYVGAVICLASVLYTFVGDWKPKDRIQVNGKAVVISGCDSGFGNMLAQRLDDLGFHVFAGCLFPDGEGAQNLKKSASSQLHILKMDVTKDEDIKEAVAFVNDKLGDNKLWAVVCNAGTASIGDISWTHIDIFKDILDVNTFGVVRLTKAFLPSIIKAEGRVVVVASIAGRFTIPGMVTYCMSKHAVISFCDGLRLETAHTGIKVVTIEPCLFKTAMTQESFIWSSLNRTWSQAPEDLKQRYSDSYLQKYLKSTMKYINSLTSDRVNDVVACLEEAILAKNPKYAYTVGTTLSRVLFWLSGRLPKPIANYVQFKLSS